MTIIFTQIALQDIDATVNYICTELHNPVASGNFLRKVFSRVDVLSQFPEISSRIKINGMLT